MDASTIITAIKPLTDFFLVFNMSFAIFETVTFKTQFRKLLGLDSFQFCNSVESSTLHRSNSADEVQMLQTHVFRK